MTPERNQRRWELIQHRYLGWGLTEAESAELAVLQAEALESCRPIDEERLRYLDEVLGNRDGTD